jgi:hypothetical protein
MCAANSTLHGLDLYTLEIGEITFGHGNHKLISAESDVHCARNVNPHNAGRVIPHV